MKLPKWIQRTLDALPKREETMGEMAAKAHALTLVECLNCAGRKAPRLSWISSLDDETIGCLNCLALEKIVKKAQS